MNTIQNVGQTVLCVSSLFYRLSYILLLKRHYYVIMLPWIFHLKRSNSLCGHSHNGKEMFRNTACKHRCEHKNTNTPCDE